MYSTSSPFFRFSFVNLVWFFPPILRSHHSAANTSSLVYSLTEHEARMLSACTRDAGTSQKLFGLISHDQSSFTKAAKRGQYPLSVFAFVYDLHPQPPSPHPPSTPIQPTADARSTLSHVSIQFGQVKSGPAFYKAPGSSLVAVMVGCCLYTGIFQQRL